MNKELKELYINYKKEEKELRKLQFLIEDLQKFINLYEKNFKRQESIIVLKKIKEYLTNNKEKLNTTKNKVKELEQKLITTCKHDIVIKDYLSYICLICGEYVEREQSKIAIDTTKEPHLTNRIIKILIETIQSDKDLIETMSKELEEMQYEREIKVYRRTK